MKAKKLKLTEEKLVKFLKEKHPQGARALYDMYSGSLLGVICRIVPEVELGEEILQDTLIRIWTAFECYDPTKGRLFTWMVNIARNLAIDRLRSKSYRNGVNTEGLENYQELPVSPEIVYDRIDFAIIRQGLSRLRQAEHQVVELIYYGGLTHVEVAEALNIPLGTVKTRLLMAIRRLKNYYRDPEIVKAA